MTTLYQALMLILNVVWWIMIAHIIMSWLINFQVLNLRQPLVAQVWDGLNRLLEPIYRPIRCRIPAPSSPARRRHCPASPGPSGHPNRNRWSPARSHPARG